MIAYVSFSSPPVIIRLLPLLISQSFPRVEGGATLTPPHAPLLTRYVLPIPNPIEKEKLRRRRNLSLILQLQFTNRICFCRCRRKWESKSRERNKLPYSCLLWISFSSLFLFQNRMTVLLVCSFNLSPVFWWFWFTFSFPLWFMIITFFISRAGRSLWRKKTLAISSGWSQRVGGFRCNFVGDPRVVRKGREEEGRGGEGRSHERGDD